MSAKRLDVRIVIRAVQAGVRQVKVAKIEDGAGASPEAMGRAASGLNEIVELRAAKRHLQCGVRHAEPAFHEERQPASALPEPLPEQDRHAAKEGARGLLVDAHAH